MLRLVMMLTQRVVVVLLVMRGWGGGSGRKAAAVVVRGNLSERVGGSVGVRRARVARRRAGVV